MCAYKLTLPFKTGRKTLSVTCGDGSPKESAKASGNPVYILTQEVERIDTGTLHELFYEVPMNRKVCFDSDSEIRVEKKKQMPYTVYIQNLS